MNPGWIKSEFFLHCVDHADGYDANARTAALCVRTLLSYGYPGDPHGLGEEIRRLIRLESARGDTGSRGG